MDLQTISEVYNIPYWKIVKLKKKLELVFVKKTLNYDQITLLINQYYKECNISFKTILLIYEFKEKFPSLNAEYISDLFCLELQDVEKIFFKEYLIIPSKLNN